MIFTTPHNGSTYTVDDEFGRAIVVLLKTAEIRRLRVEGRSEEIRLRATELAPNRAIAVIKSLRGAYDLGLREAKKIYDDAARTIKDYGYVDLPPLLPFRAKTLQTEMNHLGCSVTGADAVDRLARLAD